MNQLIAVYNSIYIPSFDENEDEYIDKSPYKPYQRNCIRFECRCKAGASFVNNTMFKQHIKTKTHKDFIKNYKKYYKEIDESKEIINSLKVELELLSRKNKKLTEENEQLLQKIDDFNDDNNFQDCLSE